MLEMWHTTSPLELPTIWETVKLPRPVDASKLRGPRMKGPQGGYCRVSVRTLRYTPQKWQARSQTSRPERQLETASAGYQRWSRLARSIRTSEGNQSPLRGEILGPANHGPNRHGLTRPRSSTLGGVRVQPHGDSYFLPGKVADRSVTFLLNS